MCGYFFTSLSNNHIFLLLENIWDQLNNWKKKIIPVQWSHPPSINSSKLERGHNKLSLALPDRRADWYICGLLGSSSIVDSQDADVEVLWMVQQMDSDYCVLADTSRRVHRSSLGMEEEDNLQSYYSPFLADRGTVVGASYSYHTLVVYKLEALKNAGNMEHLQKKFW